jgi:hypothetical protein
MDQLPVDQQDIIRELGIRDYTILQLQQHIKTILTIPGVKEAIESHSAAQQAPESQLLVPAPTLLVPDNGEPTPKRRAIKDAPQA